LTDVVIKTSYQNKPEGWEDGWNGDCEVVWAEEIEDPDNVNDWIKRSDDGFMYYYNDMTNDGVYILKLPYREKEVIIPEYIDGQKVIELGHYKIHDYSVHELTVQHQFDVLEGEVYFYNLEKLIFVDFLYCNLSTTQDTIDVPNRIGEFDRIKSKIPRVELRKSDREYSLDNFKPTVIIIPEYVTVIEKGVFDGLTGVTIRTSYHSKPEGWEDGWNGDCEVIWGALY